MLDKTTIFAYDNGGNITSRVVYRYSLADTLNLENGNTYNYEYTSNGWRDQLISYNGTVCGEYDSLGNPNIYRGKQLVWSHCRQLDSIGDVAFKYNANGVRIAKTVGGKTTKFYTDGSTIIAQENEDNTMFFARGIDGLNGFTLNGIEYFYKKNVRSDIISIMDVTGNEIVRYVYDAWGNHKTYVLENGNYVEVAKAQTNAYAEIAYINPYRYRGYYYDVETGLYYLNTRYYDPEVGRFINADDIINFDSNAYNGLNIFVYCGNNPVNGYDPNGTINWSKIFGWILTGIEVVLAIAAVVVVAVGVVASGGLLAGALVGAGIGALVGIVGSVVAQGGIQNADPWKVAGSGLIGGLIGAVAGVFSEIGSTIGQWAGSWIGSSVASMTHLTSGVVVGHVISTTAIVGITTTIGSISGGIAGSMLGNYIGNTLTNKQSNFGKDFKEGILSEIPSWLLNLFNWILR